jgi:hypothetical protein
MTIALRDDSLVEDSRFGLLQPVERLEAGSLFAAGPPDGIDLSSREPISKYRVRTFGEPGLKQGELGACAAMTLWSAREFEPGIKRLDSESAIDFYFRVQMEDSFPGGEYAGADPRAGGTSLEDCLETARRLGYIKSWCRATTLEEIIIGIGYYGTALFGMQWTMGMVEPGPDHICRPIGRVVGGHGTAGTFVRLDKKLIGGPNSWGDTWNRYGWWMMTFDGIEDRLARGGQCYFMEKA